MICSNEIVWHPYVPYNHPENLKKPFICRLASNETSFELEWLDNFAPTIPHTLHVKERNTDTESVLELSDKTAEVGGLTPYTEYELYITSENGIKSNTRYLRTGKLPCGAAVVNYLHPEDPQYRFSGQYLCSPSLVRLPSGRLIAGMDVYGDSMGQNITLLFNSDDDGKTWNYLCDVYPFYWACMFVHREKLYLLGLSTEYGNLQISCSEDEGAHFCPPSVLMYGANKYCSNGGVHRAPMQIVSVNGRLYTTVEYGSWVCGSHIPGVLSMDENDDPMCPESWHCTGFLPYDGKWKEETVTQGHTMEGNIVRLPDGGLYNILRWKTEEALALRIDEKNPDTLLTYSRVIKMPVAASMFRILPYRGGYLLITNHKTDVSEKYGNGVYRNVLSVYFSKNFEDWTLIRDIVNDENESDGIAGFQYPCVLREDDTLLVLVRSAFNNAHNFHDSNYSLFFRIELNEEEINTIIN